MDSIGDEYGRENKVPAHTSSLMSRSNRPPGPYAMINLVTLLEKSVEDWVGRRLGRSV